MTNLVTFPGLGLSFEISRVAFTIGGVNIYWYGVVIAVGLVLAMIFAMRHCTEFGIDGDSMTDVIVVGVVMAIISARAYYVAMAPFKYQSIREILSLRDGGLAIYGGIIGAVVFGGLACKWRKVPVLPMFDLTGMGFLIGQCLGRWGNFFNQEAFGCNTTLPWGMYSAATEAYLRGSTVTVPAGVTIDPTMPVHPTFLYESLWCLVGFVVLRLYMKKHLHGESPCCMPSGNCGPLLDRACAPTACCWCPRWGCAPPSWWRGLPYWKYEPDIYRLYGKALMGPWPLRMATRGPR